MFKARAPPKNTRRKPQAESDAVVAVVEEVDDDCSDSVSAKLAELKQIQKDCWCKPRGVQSTPDLAKREEEEAADEEEDKWGLDAGFSGGSSKVGPDLHMEAFINDRLYEKREVEAAKDKSREDKLYQVPESLQVPDNQEGEANKMSWIAGLAEVALPVEYKLANIEATEKAKRDYLYGEDPRKAAVLEPDSVTRKAFGSRFMHFKDNTSSKGSSDDAAIERFRKRMRK